MKRYNRKRSTTWQTKDRFAAGHPSGPNKVPLATFEPLIQKQSLQRLQVRLAGLLRNRQRIEIRMSKAIASGRLDQAKVLAKLHVASTTDAHELADEIARRTRVGEAPKPKAPRKPRDTDTHSRVRDVKPEAMPVAMPQPKPETTRNIEQARTDEREAFRAELSRRSCIA